MALFWDQKKLASTFIALQRILLTHLRSTKKLLIRTP